MPHYQPGAHGEATGDDVTADLPPDLAKVLRDPSIIVPQDAAVFEMIAKASDASTDTMSAWSADEWRAAWIEARKQSIRWQRNYRLLLESMLTVQGQIGRLFEKAVAEVKEIDSALSDPKEYLEGDPYP